MAAELLVALSFCGVAGLISLVSARRQNKNQRKTDPASPGVGERGLEALLPGDVLDSPEGPLYLGRALRVGAATKGFALYHLEAVRAERDGNAATEKAGSGWLLGVGLRELVRGEESIWLLAAVAAPSLPIKDLTVDTAPTELYHQGLRHRLSGRLRARARLENLHLASVQAVQLVSYHGPGGSRLLLIWGGITDGESAEFFAGSVIAEASLRVLPGPGPGPSSSR